MVTRESDAKLSNKLIRFALNSKNKERGLRGTCPNPSDVSKNLSSSYMQRSQRQLKPIQVDRQWRLLSEYLSTRDRCNRSRGDEHLPQTRWPRTASTDRRVLRDSDLPEDRSSSLQSCTGEIRSGTTGEQRRVARHENSKCVSQGTVGVRCLFAVAHEPTSDQF